MAWDIDTGEESDVRTLRNALPSRLRERLLITLSGKKGWHLWLFLDEPIVVEDAVQFARLVVERAGVQCEIFPSSRGSRCIKWPGQLHPETGETETFVDPRWLRDTGRLDTVAILELLYHGKYRAPKDEILAAIRNWGSKRSDARTPEPKSIHIWRPRTITDVLLGDEAVVYHLMREAGREYRGLGKPFRCILPEHEERNPSAAWWRDGRGRLIYHDFHHGIEGYRLFSLLEVHHALRTGEVQKLSPREEARELGLLLMTFAILQDRVRAVLERNTATLHSLLKPDTNDTTEPYIRFSCIASVWRFLKRKFEERVQKGFVTIPASSGFVAQECSLSRIDANRTLNLLAVLGFVAKVGTVERERSRGATWILCEASPVEARRRWEALGKPSISKVSNQLVAEKLGEEVAATVWRGANELKMQEANLCEVERK
ncbi:MAG: hypothetical protein DRI26_02145 [Chloroflexi bacterium]|nr:MAG: hypothetical protein DRI26_02145 [Chloroflexota bacterium]